MAKAFSYHTPYVEDPDAALLELQRFIFEEQRELHLPRNETFDELSEVPQGDGRYGIFAFTGCTTEEMTLFKFLILTRETVEEKTGISYPTFQEVEDNGGVYRFFPPGDTGVCFHVYTDQKPSHWYFAAVSND